jgi:hypothetical protein
MLFVSLTLPLLLMGLGYLAIRRSRVWIIVYIVCALFCMNYRPLYNNDFVGLVLEMQFLLTLVAITLARGLLPSRRSLRIYLPVAVTGASYALYGWTPIRYSAEIKRLREEYPLESVENRVPVPAPHLRPTTLNTETEALLNDLEYGRNTRGNGRANRLKTLHEQAVLSFLNSPGFGRRRMARIEPTASKLKDGVRANNDPVPQPLPRAFPIESLQPGEPTRQVAVPYSAQALHQESIVDFSNLAGRGYTQDRGHVAGFQPHAFSKVPASDDEWVVQTIDLVSLLCHAEPVAYVSDNLPRMDELREASTRPLDAFETGGLKQLVDGDYLVVGEAADKLRMLGSVRAVEQCEKCHGAERGDLLGAFSYTLRRKEQ